MPPFRLSRRELLGGAATLALGLGCGLPPRAAPSPAGARLHWTIDRRRPRRLLRGGLGASWHAEARPLEPVAGIALRGVRQGVAPRGSAWGGNPPLDQEESWADLRRHASWLGLSWLRVEMSQRMYEPERGRFDWDNDEMRALDRILDWCDAAGAEVFLQQMWSHVAWNAFPGIHPLQSGPRVLADFAEGLATAVEHLVRARGHRSIRWLAIVNEPNVPTGWWLGADGRPLPLAPALAAVRAALDRRRIDLPLSAPGWNMLRDPEEVAFDWRADPSVGAFDAHNYRGPRALGAMARWTERAAGRGIPFFVSELGDFRFGWRGSDAGPRSFDAALSNAAQILGGVARGVDGFSRWSFVNRGDLDGQWQLVRTWDAGAQRHLRAVEPEPVPYHAFAVLTRFWALRSSALSGEREGPAEVATAALESPRGELTLLVANGARDEVALELALDGVARPAALLRYRVDEHDAAEPRFRLDPAPFAALAPGANAARDRLPPRSLTAYSTYRRTHDEPGVVAEPSS